MRVRVDTYIHRKETLYRPYVVVIPVDSFCHLLGVQAAVGSWDAMGLVDYCWSYSTGVTTANLGPSCHGTRCRSPVSPSLACLERMSAVRVAITDTPSSQCASSRVTSGNTQELRGVSCD